MSKLQSVVVPSVESLKIALFEPNGVKLQGTITSQEPAKLIGGFFKAVHVAAQEDGLTAVTLDVTELKFVNSSAIRLFLDWAGWIKNSPTGTYKLQILTTKKFTWQKTSFVAITALAAGCVELRSVD